MGYHKPKSNVPFKYLKILFIFCTCVSFSVAWNLVTNHVAYIMSSLEAITYSRLPIIDLYRVWFTSFDSSSLLNLQLVIMAMLIGLQFSISNFFNTSLMYLVCEINMPLLDHLIYNPRKNDNSPSKDISNSFCISLENSLQI